MIDSKKLDTLKEHGPVKTCEDAVSFRDGLFNIVVELYDPLFAQDARDNDGLFTELVNNIADISVQNVPAAYMADAIDLVSTDQARQEISSVQNSSEAFENISTGGSLRSFYNNYTDFLIHTRRAIVAKAPKNYKDVFKIQDNAVSMNREDYELRNEAGQTKSQEDAMYKTWKERGYEAYVPD